MLEKRFASAVDTAVTTGGVVPEGSAEYLVSRNDVPSGLVPSRLGRETRRPTLFQFHG